MIFTPGAATAAMAMTPNANNKAISSPLLELDRGATGCAIIGCIGCMGIGCTACAANGFPCGAVGACAAGDGGIFAVKRTGSVVRVCDTESLSSAARLNATRTVNAGTSCSPARRAKTASSWRWTV